MEIRDNDKICIFAPLSSKLNKHESVRLLKNIMNETRTIAIDLSYVEECTIDFINIIKEICTHKRLGIFNIPSDIFALFNVMQIDKCADLFVSEIDFKEDKRQLINRRFSII